MKERRTDNNGINVNIEDTGRLMTSGSENVTGRKRVLIIVIAAVLIAAVAAAGIIISAGNKRYDEQVAIAEKAFAEGDYQQAETDYMTAVGMNRRKPEAREGLAYVYAAEEKFNESYDVYFGLYEDTDDDKYLAAAQEAKEGKLPSDPTLVPGHIVPDESGDKDLSSVYAAYAEVLRNNEKGIKLYWWQTDINGKCPNDVEVTPDETVPKGSLKNKCVVIKDITGDGIPELMYFFGGLEGISELYIYTYKDGTVVDCRYDEVVSHNGGEMPWDSAIFADTYAAAGTRYMIYTGKEPGIFYIAYSMGDETMYYNSTKYKMDDDGYIRTVTRVMNKYGPNADYSGMNDEYFIDGSKVSQKEGSSAFSRDREDFSELLMLSGNAKEDLKVFEKGETQSQAAMSYDEAVSWLQQQGQ